MTQKQEIVPLYFLDGTKGEAISTGNNAAWHCKCERTLPLLGRSGKISGPTDGYKVECPYPGCRRGYFVEPGDTDQGKVLQVKEI
jgi:hypothetical protein